MKIGVKPSDLAYHSWNPSHPLSLYKEESLIDKVKFPQYSTEAFLKDIEAHSNLKPVSKFDLFSFPGPPTLEPSSPEPPPPKFLSPELEPHPLTPAQKVYWLLKAEEPILEHLEFEFETEFGTTRYTLGDSSDSSSGEYLHYFSIFEFS